MNSVSHLQVSEWLERPIFSAEITSLDCSAKCIPKKQKETSPNAMVVHVGGFSGETDLAAEEYRTNLEKSLPTMALNLPKVDSITFALVNSLSSKLLATLPSFKNLKTLNAQISIIPEEMNSQVDAITQLTQVERLNLSGWPLTDANVEKISTLTQLQALEVSSRHVTDQGVSKLAPLNRLEHLKLGCVNFTGAPLADLPFVVHLKALLIFQGTNFKNEGLSHLRRSTQLETLILHNCILLTDEAIPHLISYVALKDLTLTNSPKISKQGLTKFPSTLSLYMENGFKLETPEEWEAFRKEQEAQSAGFSSSIR